ncbi:cytochrome c oxidase accessory protein CcoG [Gynurincola endophyticus]|uniref:cytochrome c oxidase accessory protein CcoG n=1 Tax=Gynurincola endophyticus TaxID=2479004 RepID=UPI000F8DC48A|nr:cytochrome c oxidase accessory protein CcoG [Gynurincola endophyticus]
MTQVPQSQHSFRDRLATVDEKGKRKWIYATKPKGKLYNVRTWVSFFFFFLFFALPFIKVNGRPFFLFDITQAKFILFGKVFWPQDFFIFGVTMVTFVIFIVLFTTAFGRLFCGWVCPQTIFMEMLFRKVEYFIEGNAAAQRQLNNSPMSAKKLFKKTAKHLSFFLLAFVISNTFLSYIIGIDELKEIITGDFSEHYKGFLAILIFSGVFYGVYAFFREQVCTVVCPYGRLQGVLLDKNSMIVAYDYQRGEPRGNSKKSAIPLGDCIDCNQCVKVCPTGIDIRNGVQMECIGCTACIDACNNVMEALNRNLGLIRYASENGIQQKQPLRFTTRMKLYTGLLVVLVGILSALLFSRTDVDATFLRAPGMLFQEHQQDSISNLYNVSILNKTNNDMSITLKLTDVDGRIQVIGTHQEIHLKPQDQSKGTFFVILPKEAVTDRKLNLKIAVYEGEKLIVQKKVNFLGPIKRKK